MTREPGLRARRRRDHARGERHAEGRLRQRRRRARPSRSAPAAAAPRGAPLSDVTNGSGQASFAVKDATVETSSTTRPTPPTRCRSPTRPRSSFTAGLLASITMNPANATVAAGVAQTYTVRGYDAFGHDLGDVTAATTFVINPDGTCIGASCSATVAGPHTVIATNSTNGVHTTTASLTVTPAAASAATSTITASPDHDHGQRHRDLDDHRPPQGRVLQRPHHERRHRHPGDDGRHALGGRDRQRERHLHRDPHRAEPARAARSSAAP